MGGGSVSRWEDLTGDDEGGGVGSKVLEKVGKDVEGKFPLDWDHIVTESEDTEDDGQHHESHELDRLSSDNVERCDGEPIPGNETGAREDDVTDTLIVESVVDKLVWRGSVTDSSEDDGRVETETVEGDVEYEPGSRASEKDLAVSPLRVVSEEVAP